MHSPGRPSEVRFRGEKVTLRSLTETKAPRSSPGCRDRIQDVVFLPGHLPGVATPVGTCAANGLIRRQSTKKPIRVFLNRCRWFLKQLTESTSNACWSRLFHLLISLLVKKLRLTSKVLRCFFTISINFRVSSSFQVSCHFASRCVWFQFV